MAAKNPASHHLVLALLPSFFALGCPSDGVEEPSATAMQAQEYSQADPAGDINCPEDPSATGAEVPDIRGMQMRQDGENLETIIAFDRPIDEWDAARTEKLPFGLSMWFGEEYVETLFSGKTVMKVVDGKAEVFYELNGHRMKITLTKLDLDRLSRARASISVGDARWTGLCEDESTLDPQTATKGPLDIDLDDPAPNNGNPNNVMTATGPKYIMLTDTSPMTSGDFPGSDIDRVEVCKSVNSDCTTADVLAAETAEVVNASGILEVGGADACTNGTYASLGGGHVILTFSDPSIDIVEGDNIRAFSVTEVTCAEAGPNTEQSYDVAVGTSEVLDTFTTIGECGASIPCRLPVPQGI